MAAKGMLPAWATVFHQCKDRIFVPADQLPELFAQCHNNNNHIGRDKFLALLKSQFDVSSLSSGQADASCVHWSFSSSAYSG